MRISILGLGYVGAVCTACLADRGHHIIGVDVSDVKIDLINQGRSPIVEPELGELLRRGVTAGLIRGTADIDRAVMDTDLSMICVGTPSKKNGDLDLAYVKAVCIQIGEVLARKRDRHTVVVRSTVLPGTVRNVVIPLLESCSGKRAGVDFGVAVNPEFLRESTAVHDYRNPPITVIGELDPLSGDVLETLYRHLDAPIVRQGVEVAEMIKYTCNVWHAVKVSFANEIGNIAKALGVDGREVMNILCRDNKLNISEYYMRPGFAFGGSCLPKDIRALSYRASRLDVEHPLLSAVLPSNRNQLQKAFDLVSSLGGRRIGLLGLSFKAGTDDLRESPLVELAEMMIGKGYDLAIYDRHVEYSRVNGANREFIETRIPHVSSLLTDDLDQVVAHAEVLVIGNNDKSFARVVHDLPVGKKVVDLVGVLPHPSTETHQGICW
ncbi:nucleotide sugar dehydrogenase [Thermodesulfobacteriota bacterium B35]